MALALARGFELAGTLAIELFITKDGEVVTPKSDSILPSITRRSLVHVPSITWALR